MGIAGACHMPAGVAGVWGGGGVVSSGVFGVGSAGAAGDVVGFEEDAGDDRLCWVVGDPVAAAFQPGEAERGQIRIGARRGNAAFGRVGDDEAGFGQGMPEVAQGLGALAVGVEAFQRFDLARCFWGECYQGWGSVLSPSAVMPCSVSMRSAAARRRSSTGSSGTVAPVAICALDRSRLSRQPGGAGAAFCSAIRVAYAAAGRVSRATPFLSTTEATARIVRP